MSSGRRLLVAGRDGLPARAIRSYVRHFANDAWRIVDSSGVDFSCRGDVERLFAREKPEFVIVTGGRAGGIALNTRCPADLMRDNLATVLAVLEVAVRFRVSKLLYLASSCVYPPSAPVPFRVESLWCGPLEPTSSAYAMARLCGMEMCRAYRRQFGAPFISAIPADLFGPEDDFDSEDSHVVAGLMRRMHAAKERGEPRLVVWGSGQPRRELLFSHDFAAACLLALEKYDDEPPLNVGGGTEISIADLAKLIQEITQYPGEILFDPSRPDGAPRKVLDSSVLDSLGWRPSTPLREALARTDQALQNGPREGSLAATV